MNDIQALRTHLFNTLQALQDKDNPMDIDRAKTICQVGDVIIDSAKAEIDFARVIGNVETQFFQKQVPQLVQQTELAPKIQHESEPKNTKTGTVQTVGHITTHKMKA